MSFYSSFSLCRPTKPPVVTAASLAAFLESFEALGLSQAGGFFYLNVKFGRAVDRNDKGTTIYTWVLPGMAQVGSIAWDLNPRSPGSLRTIIDHLRLHSNRPIYRAEIGLGGMTDELSAFVNSTEGFEGDANLGLHSWHFAIGPQNASLLSSDEEFFTGWLQIGMDGDGYLFPLTVKGLVRRAEAHPGLAALADLCRQTWPVAPEPVKEPLWWYLPHKRKRHVYDMQGGRPSRRVQRARATMGEAWPYPIDAPFDWHWNVNETG